MLNVSRTPGREPERLALRRRRAAGAGRGAAWL